LTGEENGNVRIKEKNVENMQMQDKIGKHGKIFEKEA
jgi:hypothetical protein